MATRAKSERCPYAFVVLLVVAVLVFSPAAAARSVVSGWDVSLSTGSSDSTLWRKFTTPGQATSYHRLLLGLETSRKALEVGEVAAVEVQFFNKVASNDFNSMDYEQPQSNRAGSSDQTTSPPPAP